MPSFDIVSEVNHVEIRNAVDQCNREIANRFDFKGSDARVEIDDKTKAIYLETLPNPSFLVPDFAGVSAVDGDREILYPLSAGRHTVTVMSATGVTASTTFSVLEAPSDAARGL